MHDVEGDVLRCPFVRAVADGRPEDAARLALAGPEPADPGTVPVLLIWAARAAVGLPVFGTDPYEGCAVYLEHGACSCSTGVPGNSCPASDA